MIACMTDHPGWRSSAEGSTRCFVNAQGPFQVTVFPDGNYVAPGAPTPEVLFDQHTPRCASLHIPKNLQVYRWKTRDLWEGLAAGIVRQVIRAGQARSLYQSASDRWGEELFPGWKTFPSPAKIISLSTADLKDGGLAFQAPKLRAAAEWVLAQKRGDVEAATLNQELTHVPGIGEWTRRVVLADITNDFSWYPYDDMAVRKRAQQLWPEKNFSSQADLFASQWEQLTGPQLGPLTAFTLSGVTLLGE